MTAFVGKNIKNESKPQGFKNENKILKNHVLPIPMRRMGRRRSAESEISFPFEGDIY
jgi:hypothetical protein